MALEATMRVQAILSVILIFTSLGCHHHKITAVPLSQHNKGEPKGIPYYLPKPLLVISKNVRHIEESKVGLTDTVPIPNDYDDQAKYADLNSRSSFSKADSSGAGSGEEEPSEERTAKYSQPRLYDANTPNVTPSCDKLETFFTYQIIFVPDLSQKYGLRIKGGPGEIRATMNMVNGWMYTGMGPYYMKDSSTAQNILAAGIGANLAGSGVADVIDSVADLRDVATKSKYGSDMYAVCQCVERLMKQCNETARLYQNRSCDKTAEIYVYEQVLLPDGSTQWRSVASHQFGNCGDGSCFDPSGMPMPLGGGEFPALPHQVSKGTTSEHSMVNIPSEADQIFVQDLRNKQLEIIDQVVGAVVCNLKNESVQPTNATSTLSPELNLYKLQNAEFAEDIAASTLGMCRQDTPVGYRQSCGPSCYAGDGCCETCDGGYSCYDGGYSGYDDGGRFYNDDCQSCDDASEGSCSKLNLFGLFDHSPPQIVRQRVQGLPYPAPSQ